MSSIVNEGLAVARDAHAAEEKTVSHAEYVRTLRADLPAEAFRPYTGAYLWIAVNLAVIVAGWAAAAHSGRAWWPLIGVVISVSLSTIAFLAHDLSHRSITISRYFLYPTELVLWGILVVPATLWRRLHSTHHAHTNTEKDPDRRFLKEELTGVGRVAGAMMFPNRVLRYSLVHLLYWVFFPFRHGIVALFYPGNKHPTYVTGKPRYQRRDKLTIVLEFAFIAVLHYSLIKILGTAYLWTVALPIAVTSAVISWYFFTNHGLKPVHDHDDIVATTTTVTVPKICDYLHSNFSYHTEHHLFPNMHPKYYPLVTRLLRKHYPERYHCIPMGEAWSQLLKNSVASPSVNRPSDTGFPPPKGGSHRAPLPHNS